MSELSDWDDAGFHKLDMLLKHLPDGILVLRSGGQILLSNPAAEEYLGILADLTQDGTVSHIGGRPLRELLSPPQAGAHRHEIEVKTPSRRVFEATSRPIAPGPDGDEWLLLLRDITHERQVQSCIEQQEHLASVGQLASGIAHDFNNLLMGVIGFAQMLQLNPEMSNSTTRDLERIVELGQRAAGLVKQILDSSRASARKYHLFDLAIFLKEATKFLQRTIPEHIRISLEVAPGEYLVNGDPTQIRQALINLAVNSRDAMPEGGELRVELSRIRVTSAEDGPRPGLSAGEWLVLAVSDTGVGIAPEILPRIFDPFFTTKGRGRGTGLGMAQVHGAVKRHEGSIDVKSAAGQGTTVTVFLPVPVLTGPPDPDVKRTDHRFPRGNGELILLVEDEPEVLQISRQMLEALGYRVVTAPNGLEALAIFERYSPGIALVITDMLMPGMGGMRLLQAVRDRDPDVKVIMLSGYPLESDTETLRKQGVTDWIQKPVDLSQMAHVIRRAIQESADS